jgi:hypothetical protein
MPELVAPLPNLIVEVKEPIEGPDRAEIEPFVEQGGIDLSGRGVGEARAMEQIQSLLAFLAAQSALRCGARASDG